MDLQSQYINYLDCFVHSEHMDKNQFIKIINVENLKSLNNKSFDSSVNPFAIQITPIKNENKDVSSLETNYDLWQKKHEITIFKEFNKSTNLEDVIVLKNKNTIGNKGKFSSQPSITEPYVSGPKAGTSVRSSGINSVSLINSQSLFPLPDGLVQVPPLVSFKDVKESFREKINIDDVIENVGDLLNVLNKYPYDDTKEYNIDLKKLMHIKSDLEELNRMVGMEELKTSIIDQLFYFLQDLHLTSTGGDFKHTVIYGPPGTGKTEVAKIIGRMFSKIGILQKDVFKKVVRGDLIAGYLGQTAIKTKNIIKECLGGVLFIDEAYSLALNTDVDTFSQECIDTLCEALSTHKNELMVIVAGYENEMNNVFFKANRGLESRFIWRFKIDNYTASELMQIYWKNIMDASWEFDGIWDTPYIVKWFDAKKDKFVHFGRDMEILFLYTKISHAKRIYGKSQELRKKISIIDMENGYKIFLKNCVKPKDVVRYPELYV